ncbi:MAG: DUF998 domain-containing protein [Nocardioidaceae bacterium]
MAQRTGAPERTHQTATPRVSTTRLLAGGIVAGPLFLVVWALQAFTREGFDPSRHPLSLLSLGDLGWVQIANFVVTGTLFAACAVGMRRALQLGLGGTWGPRLIGAFGAGLIGAGVFVTDPGAGFPTGAPAGAPEVSWHGALHEVGYVVAMLSWTAAAFVLRRRFAARGERGLSRLCVTAVAAVLVVSAWPHLDSLSIRIVIATGIQFGLVAVLAAHLRLVCK